MEGIFALVGFIALCIPIAVVYLLISHARLKGQVRLLQENLRTQNQQTPAEPEPAQERKSPTVTPPLPASAPVPARVSAEPEQKDDSSAEVSQPPETVPPAPTLFDKFGPWLGENWFYVVSAVSLALAGIFLVQYGVEAGYLPPPVRVLFALLFGAALIGAGEVIRRRFGDGADQTTAYLPSVFSSAGIVTLFGGVLAARLLYDLIGPEVALIGMVVTATIALVLGWFYGPLLAGIGIIGAFAAPFFVGGSTDDVDWLYGYFLIIAALGLGIDTIRRWAWVTVLTLVLAYGAGILIGQSASIATFAIHVTVLAFLAVLIPTRSLRPDHGGPMMIEGLINLPKGDRPAFPTWVGFGAVLVSSLALTFASGENEAAFWLAIILLTGLGVQLVFWSNRAPALQDTAILPAAGFLAAIGWQGGERLIVWRSFQATYDANPEADSPLVVTVLLVLGVVISCAALWRALVSKGSTARFSLIWAGVAALVAPIAAITLELVWQPALVMGPYPWALHAAALAALMVGFAERLAHTDGPDDRLRMSLPVLSALASIAFALTIIFTQTALTFALLVTVIAAAGLDRMFRMPLMTAFISIGVAVVGYRLVADPGLEFGFEGPLAEVFFNYGGTVTGFVAGVFILRDLERPTSKTVLESAAWAVGGILLSLLLFRWLDALTGSQQDTHWAMGLFAVIWLALMAAQLERLTLGGWLRFLRIGLAVIFGLFGFGALLIGLTLMNPLLDGWSNTVLGPPVINSLAVGYLLPAAILWLTAIRQGNVFLRKGFLAIAVGLAGFWVFMVIRHFWQGSNAMALGRGMTQPELYSYTVALLIVGGTLFYQALARPSDIMRRAGLSVIMLAVAKVFLVDAGELTGLTRVFSFLFLGLALAGLAWLGRWAKRSAVNSQGDQDAQPHAKRAY